MTSENKKWHAFKAEYLRKVEKALLSVKHPRSKDILEDVRTHLDCRFAELEPDQQTRENFQAIITEMGPAYEYAELLEPDAVRRPRYAQRKYLLWFGLVTLVIVAAILLPIVRPNKNVGYIVTFKPIAPFDPQTDEELLNAFNEKYPEGVIIHHYKTVIKDNALLGLIRVDTKAAKDAIVSMLEKSEKLALVEAKLETVEELEKFYKVGGPSSLERIGRTVSRTGNWPKGSARIIGSVYRRAPHKQRIGHAKVCLSSEEFGSWVMEVSDDGRFDFENIPAVVYTLRTIETFGYKDTYYNPEKTSAEQPTFELNRAETKHADIEVEPVRPYGRISGRVLDEDGKPIQLQTRRLRVVAWVQKPQGYWKGHYRRISTSWVNEDGSYLLDGLDGRPVYVQVIDWDAPKKDGAYPPRFYPGTFSRTAATLVTFEDEDIIENADISMQRTGGVVLNGLVTDEKTGQPVSEALVSIFHHDMFVDLFCGYTDKQGRYKIQGLGEGKFIVHVDAVHKGFVKTRKLVTIEAEAQETQIDFTLRRGVTISGRFVDAKGNPWQVGRGDGRAYIEGKPRGRTGRAMRYPNKYAPEKISEAGLIYSEKGEGDYTYTEMVFPTQSSFLLPAVMPGMTLFDFHPRASKGEQVLKILYQGRDINRSRTGLVTEPGQEIKDVTIVIGPSWRR
jgi:protocatechuate 3,4-dioxygenase beta subunit